MKHTPTHTPPPSLVCLPKIHSSHLLCKVIISTTELGQDGEPLLGCRLVTYQLPFKYQFISRQLRWDKGLRSQLGDFATSELNWNTEQILDNIYILNGMTKSLLLLSVGPSSLLTSLLHSFVWSFLCFGHSWSPFFSFGCLLISFAVLWLVRLLSVLVVLSGCGRASIFICIDMF